MERIPENSRISTYTTDAYFADCFACDIDYENQPALDIFLSIARGIPSWVEHLMSIRNNIVSKLGLKNLGALSGIDNDKLVTDYKVGERVGIFILHSHTHNEVILEDRDKHLDVKVSFYVEPNGSKARVYANTVVHVHNMFGKIYMFFVAPVHKLIVPSSLKALPQIERKN
ncbi:hypothetical protein A7985_04060 [Pseudoalteromonas luteoviolacea]|uniref:DUF2867 domain-containing protein n=1 Tax=Pseudoalteromonas luteoviolacea TaxID=43657 RepID=A0A1C0TUY7_9GAMM|nr:DUF2867 domain-containing protein [Pseudoalteromonas luteoviolacea]OCQ23133.1 hypothetical protein A7985_04060 [Pseudoalteromonas luteoviolacea]